MQKKDMKLAKHREIGVLGEALSRRYLEERSFVFVDANYRKSFGEIDLIMRKDKVLYFVEVKTSTSEKYAPEEHLTKFKIQKFERVVNFYIKEKKFAGDYSLGALFVSLDTENKSSEIRFLENIF